MRTLRAAYTETLTHLTPRRAVPNGGSVREADVNNSVYTALCRARLAWPGMAAVHAADKAPQWRAFTMYTGLAAVCAGGIAAASSVVRLCWLTPVWSSPP